jgi:hypothetical protein
MALAGGCIPTMPPKCSIVILTRCLPATERRKEAVRLQMMPEIQMRNIMFDDEIILTETNEIAVIPFAENTLHIEPVYLV